MFNILKRICGDTIGLYRDDGLAKSQGPTRTSERTKKQICKRFANKNLKITIEVNKKVVNYLDVTLDLNTGKHYPFMKPGNVPSHVQAKSNRQDFRITPHINYAYKLRFNPKNIREKPRRKLKRIIS